MIGTILSVFILLSYFNHRETITRLSYTQLLWNIESAFNIAQSESFIPEDNYQWKKNTFNDDSIKIKKLQWGAFTLVATETKNRHQYIKKVGLFGISSFRDTAIMVSDVGRPINLAGTIKFNGYCYFPKGAYKTTFIEGQGFSADGNISGFIKQSPQNIPEVKLQFLKELETCVTGLNSNTDSIITNIETVNNSFTSKTAIYQANQVRLENNILIGNVKLVISDEVIIEKSTQLEDILIVAKKVRIKKDFTGSLQIIASDSILLEENCFLKYPSSLIVMKKSKIINEGMGTISLDKNCKVNGSVIVINTEKTENPNVFLSIDKECEIYGLIYSSGYAGLQGKIFGNAFAQKLLLKTTSAVYENHLLNCEIDSRKYSTTIVIPAIFEKNKLNKCAKWL
ncbi:MAG: hypothetical protein KA163_07305 [Bacteroidia bacterium]|nr:hypothetical protein [Bacteroidia bacterium]